MASRSDELIETDSVVDFEVPIDASDDPIVGGGAAAGTPSDDEFHAVAGTDDDDQFDEPDPDPPPVEVEGTSSLLGTVLGSVSRLLNPTGWFGWAGRSVSGPSRTTQSTPARVGSQPRNARTNVRGYTTPRRDQLDISLTPTRGVPRVSG